MNKTIIYILMLFLFLPISFASITEILDQAVPVSYCNNRYELEAIYISDNQVKFRLNNETSDILGRHDLFEFKEGSSIYVREILEEEVKEGPDRVSIRFYPEICEAVEEEVIANFTEEIVKDVPEKEIIEEEEPVDEIDVIKKELEKEVEKLNILEIIINWFRKIFKR
ncbi:hypothetical protein KY342_04395 [Candidatus Woesearchaeota archaeon]|nr:hypothetical protein [Candidatus Woesearchaeota archaeon]